MTETRWWWIRHAPVTANRGRLYGQHDHPCEVEDPPTFEALAGLMPKDAVWVTSTLQRTTQTAAAIRERMAALTPEPEAHPELMEQSFGDWQGRSYEDVRKGDLGFWHRFWLAPAEVTPPGGESFVDVMTRVGDKVYALSKAHAGRDIVAVTHGGTIRAALALALGLQPEHALRLAVHNCSLTRIDHVPGPIGSHDPDQSHAWCVQYHNLSPRHLAEQGHRLARAAG
ncbi:MAG: histidine phosphatase family protein [Rhodospirillales bacterium]|nr:histidine phosphatase family protein [Rhodospirillales bacterium]